MTQFFSSSSAVVGVRSSHSSDQRGRQSLKFEVSAVEKHPQTTAMEPVKEVEEVRRKESMDTVHNLDTHSQGGANETQLGGGEEESRKADAERDATEDDEQVRKK